MDRIKTIHNLRLAQAALDLVIDDDSVGKIWEDMQEVIDSLTCEWLGDEECEITAHHCGCEDYLVL